MTRKLARIGVASCIAVMLGAMNCNGPDLGNYHEALSKNGYQTAFLPPHGGMNAGVIVFGTASGRSLDIQRIVCPDGLFAGVAIRSDPVGLAGYQGTTSYDIDLGFTILKKVLGNDLSAKLEANRKGETKVRFSDPQEHSLSDSAIYSGTGLRELKADCHKALQALKARGEYDDHVFLLTNVVRAKVTYEFALDAGGKAGASGTPLREILNASAGAGWAVTGNTNLTIDAPLFLAARSPVLVKRFVPEGIVSAASFARVEFQKIDVGEARVSAP